MLPYEGDVRSWLRRHLHSLTETDADDLIQEAYARLWLSDFSHIQNGRNYFHTIVRNLLVEHVRRARIVPMERLGEIEALRIPSEAPGPERHVSARQELGRLISLLEKLPAQSRTAFQLQKFYGLSRKEIAQRMSITEKTVEKHLATALFRILHARRDEDRDGPQARREEDGYDSRTID